MVYLLTAIIVGECLHRVCYPMRWYYHMWTKKHYPDGQWDHKYHTKNRLFVNEVQEFYEVQVGGSIGGLERGCKGGREGAQFGREGARWIQENPNSAAPKMASVVIEFIPLDSRTDVWHASVLRW